MSYTIPPLITILYKKFLKLKKRKKFKITIAYRNYSLYYRKA